MFNYNNADIGDLILTHDNHFKFGYNGKWFNERKKDSDSWQVHYGPCTRISLDFASECIRAAELIGAHTNKLPWLFMSGGIDSEIMALSFLKAKVPFLAVTLKFSNNLNWHDIIYAQEFTSHHQIKHKIIEFDIKKFFESDEFYQIARQTRCVSPQFPALMKLATIANSSGGYPVIGSGECYFRKESNSWVLYEREKVASLYRYLIHQNIEGCAGFFQYTPEQIKSFMDDPIMKDLFSGSYPGKPSNYSLKFDIYSNYYKIKVRPKFTGYENLSENDAKIRSYLLDCFAGSDAVAKTSHQSLEKSLSV